MTNVQFSVFYHYPSIIAKECIVLGVLAYEPATNKFIFNTVKNTNRVATFNDELNIELLKNYLKAMKKNIERLVSKNQFDMYNFTRHYVNELQFDIVKTVEVEESFEEFVKECTRQYMSFDYAKKDRPKKDSQIKFLKGIIGKSEVSDGQLYGSFKEKINLDFLVSDYGFKFIYSNHKNITSTFNNAKIWRYNASILKNTYNLKIIFIVNFEKDDSELSGVYELLSEFGSVMTYDDALQFVDKKIKNDFFNLCL